MDQRTHKVKARGSSERSVQDANGVVHASTCTWTCSCTASDDDERDTFTFTLHVNGAVVGASGLAYFLRPRGT